MTSCGELSRKGFRPGTLLVESLFRGRLFGRDLRLEDLDLVVGCGELAGEDLCSAVLLIKSLPGCGLCHDLGLEGLDLVTGCGKLTGERLGPGSLLIESLLSRSALLAQSLFGRDLGLEGLDL